jgi:hypothetical protein
VPLELGNINIGSLVQAATMPPAIQFMQGLAQLPDVFNKAQFDASQAQEQRLNTKSLQMQIAKNQWDQTVAMIQKNPELAKSPAIIHKMQALTGDTGYVLPLGPNGTSIDSSVWGADFNEFMKDKDFQERWWATDERGRRAMASAMHLTGISDEAYTAHPVLTAGEAVLQGRLKVAVNNEKRLENLSLTQGTLNTARAWAVRQNITIQQGKLDLARKALQDKMWEVKYKTDALEKIAGKKILSALDIASINALQRELSASQREAAGLVNGLDRTIGNAYDAGVDDSQLTGLQNDRDSYDKTLGEITAKNQAFTESLGPRLNDSHGRAVSGQSNKSATVTDAAPGGGNYIKGHIYTDRYGRSAVYLGGSNPWQPITP